MYFLVRNVFLVCPLNLADLTSAQNMNIKVTFGSGIKPLTHIPRRRVNFVDVRACECSDVVWTGLDCDDRGGQ